MPFMSYIRDGRKKEIFSKKSSFGLISVFDFSSSQTVFSVVFPQMMSAIYMAILIATVYVLDEKNLMKNSGL